MDARFDAINWRAGTNGVGFEKTPGEFRDLLATRIDLDARGSPNGVFVRIPFQVEYPGDYAGMALYMRYDDGFAAYLNGRQIASRNAPFPLEWHSTAAKQNSTKAAVTPELFKVSRSVRYLKKGLNILAIHGLNGGGDDMLILPELVALRKGSEIPEVAASPGSGGPGQAVAREAQKGGVKQVEGRFGEAYQFEKEGSIELGAREDHAIGVTSFTLSLWFTRDPESIDSQARRLVSAGAGGEDKAGWALWITRKADGLSFAVGNGGSRSSVAAKDGSLASGEWRHAAVSVDRGNKTVSLFIDGKLVADRRMRMLGEGNLPSGSGLSIGRNSDDRQHHRGKIDDLAIWRRALLPEEIEKIVSSGKGLGEIFEEEE
ncbi:MAG: LamG domain-containing protein, partial [Akkermansiaceae bacterium]|nr:LamG domain-containing protein [Akkermansiaceae bacterium]